MSPPMTEKIVKLWSYSDVVDSSASIGFRKYKSYIDTSLTVSDHRNCSFDTPFVMRETLIKITTVHLHDFYCFCGQASKVKENQSYLNT